MNNIEQAQELFIALEDNRSHQAADVAKRAFCIQERLACAKN